MRMTTDKRRQLLEQAKLNGAAARRASPKSLKDNPYAGKHSGDNPILYAEWANGWNGEHSRQKALRR